MQREVHKQEFTTAAGNAKYNGAAERESAMIESTTTLAIKI